MRKYIILLSSIIFTLATNKASWAQDDSLYYNGYLILEKRPVAGASNLTVEEKSFEDLVIDSLKAELKSPFLAATASIIPGMGFVYMEDWEKSLIYYSVMFIYPVIPKIVSETAGKTNSRNYDINNALDMIFLPLAIGAFISGYVAPTFLAIHQNEKIIIKWRHKYPEIVDKWEKNEK